MTNAGAVGLIGLGEIGQVHAAGTTGPADLRLCRDPARPGRAVKPALGRGGR